MNNFISTFEELSKLYDTEVPLNESVEPLSEGKFQDSLKKVATRLGADAATVVRCITELVAGDSALYDIATNIENKAVLKALQSGNERVLNSLTTEDVEELKQDIEDYYAKKSGASVEESCEKEALEEATDDDVIEIEDDEIAEEEPATEEPNVDAPKQVVLECSKCGALVIKDDASLAIDEDSDLVNVEDPCEYCEETAGYKIIGAVIPFEAALEVSGEEEVIEEEPVENKEELEELLDFDVPINITANDNNVAVGGIN